MANLRKLCDKHNVLLIWDEIQTGFCRTGKKFAWMHEDSKPDLMCIGKALGGGVMPVSAVVGTKEVLGVFHPGDHGSTFGGNPLACVIGIATIEEMVEKHLEENSAKMGAKMKEAFQNLGYEAIEEVRGEGLLIGLEVKEGVDTVKLGEAFIAEGVLTKETRSRTFRFAPPLIITPEIVDEVVAKVSKALSTVSKQLVGA
jgi:ornithine--oxo-acid transaminase